MRGHGSSGRCASRPSLARGRRTSTRSAGRGPPRSGTRASLSRPGCHWTTSSARGWRGTSPRCRSPAGGSPSRWTSRTASSRCGPPRRCPAAAPPPGTDGWLAPLLAVDGPPARREVEELEARLAALEGELVAARRRADERARQLAADVAVGLVPSSPDVEATAEQLGRPPIRSGAPRALALGFAGAALAAETWQVALPLLVGAGVDPAALRSEAVRAPAEVGLASVFALAVATGLFALVQSALDSGVALFRGDADHRRRRWLAAATLGAGGLSRAGRRRGLRAAGLGGGAPAVRGAGPAPRRGAACRRPRARHRAAARGGT